jgi:ectoine hydroxylase-related dioxygenase (phytanoyl-CoA dioxygenase family)
VLDPAELEVLQRWVAEIERWPSGSHNWGHNAEQTPAGAAICRTENVSACHPGVAMLVGDALRGLAAAALGEPATAFKDKVNYKQPGGAGFSPHQDRLAYPGVERVLSVLVAIDECSAESGCLWLADGVDGPLPTDDRGVVRPDVAADLAWSAAELAPGDAVCIDGLAPHYSEANRSVRPRRVLVASYAPAREGYGREHYYSAREAEMTRASAEDGRFRISTLADFDGAEVPTDTQAVGRCTHAQVDEVRLGGSIPGSREHEKE